MGHGERIKEQARDKKEAQLPFEAELKQTDQSDAMHTTQTVEKIFHREPCCSRGVGVSNGAGSAF